MGYLSLRMQHSVLLGTFTLERISGGAQAVGCCLYTWLGLGCWVLPLHLAGLQPLGVAFTPGWAPAIGCCLHTWLGSSHWVLPLHLAGLKPLGVAFTPGWDQAIGCGLYTRLGSSHWVLPLHQAGLKPLGVAFTPGWAQAVGCGLYTSARLQIKGEQHSFLICCLETGQTDDTFGAMMMSDLWLKPGPG